MKHKRRLLLISIFPFMLTICAAQGLVSIIHGTVKKVEHTIKVAEQATVHGTEQGFYGLKQGSEVVVVVRYSEKGADKTSDDLGKVGKDGMKVSKGTITKIDRSRKTLVVKSADGTEKTFEYAAKDLGKATGKGTKKSAEVTAYYRDEGGKNVAHFFAS